MIVEHFPYLDSQALFSSVSELEWSQYFDSGVLSHNEQVSKNAKYDVLLTKPVATILCDGNSTKLSRSGKTSISDQDPLDLLRELISSELGHYDPDSFDPAETPRGAYLPGGYGYVSYDYARLIEQLPEMANDDIQLPLVAMGIYQTVVVVDHVLHETRLIGVDQGSACFSMWRDLLATTLEQVNQAEPIKHSWADNQGRSDQALRATGLHENLDYPSYIQAFNRVQDYIVKGDCYQVNLAKQFNAHVEGNAWHTYCYLRNISPAPYATFMRFPFADILSNSPESFIQCRAGTVASSPIKGTSPRDHVDPVNDANIAKELQQSAKDRAENLMIVDLMRNDLSRCCKPNSVIVPELFKVHSFANVHHLISKIVGQLDDGVDAIELFKSCFPGGSITGAPKIRAMQIIEELEPDRRGIYCGAICYFGMDGDLESNIAIRTITVKEGVANYGAGGGLVIDSDVDMEYQEIIDKARMMKQALDL